MFHTAEYGAYGRENQQEFFLLARNTDQKSASYSEYEVDLVDIGKFFHGYRRYLVRNSCTCQNNLARSMLKTFIN